MNKLHVSYVFCLILFSGGIILLLTDRAVTSTLYTVLHFYTRVVFNQIATKDDLRHARTGAEGPTYANEPACAPALMFFVRKKKHTVSPKQIFRPQPSVGMNTKGKTGQCHSLALHRNLNTSSVELPIRWRIGSHRSKAYRHAHSSTLLKLKTMSSSHTLEKYDSRSSTKRWTVSSARSSLSLVSIPKVKNRPAYRR